MELLLEVALTIALPAFIATLWQLDNRLQTVEFRLRLVEKSLKVKSNRHTIAISQITAFLTRTTEFIPRSYFGPEDDPWPGDDPPTGLDLDD